MALNENHAYLHKKCLKSDTREIKLLKCNFELIHTYKL